MAFDASALRPIQDEVYDPSEMRPARAPSFMYVLGARGGTRFGRRLAPGLLAAVFPPPMVGAALGERGDRVAGGVRIRAAGQRRHPRFERAAFGEQPGHFGRLRRGSWVRLWCGSTAAPDDVAPIGCHG